MNLRKRLTGLFTDPKREWSLIAAEPSDVGRLYREFIVIVAAVPAAALLLRFILAASPVLGLRIAVSMYLIALATPLVAALVIGKLAPRFHSSGTTAETLKLVAYSSAPTWLAGAFYLVPGLRGVATLVAVLYGIYLYALGLPRLLKTPREQMVPFMVVSALLLLVINIVLSALLTGTRMF